MTGWLDGTSGSGRLGPRQHAQRVCQHGADLPQHSRADIAVDDPVVERQRQRADLANGQLSLVHPWRILDLPERQDRGLAWGKNRRAGVYAEDSDVGNRDRAAAQISGGGLACPRDPGQLADRSSQVGSDSAWASFTLGTS